MAELIDPVSSERRPEHWQWHGHAAHFISGPQCCWHLATTVGDYLVSSVGCWHPRGSDPLREHPPRPIGGGPELYETMVFPTKSADWIELDGARYMTAELAEAGHLAMCAKWARA